MRINTETASVDLTFEIGVWFNCATHCLYMQTFVPNYFKILCIKKLQPGHVSKHTNTETASVTLTFEGRDTCAILF